MAAHKRKAGGNRKIINALSVMNNSISIFFRMKHRWIGYWFSQTSPIGFAVFRIAFGLVLLLYHVPRLWYIGELYTKKGYLFPMHLFFVLHLLIPSYSLAVALNIVLVSVIIFLILGYKTRFFAIIVFILHTYFSLLERFSTKGYGAIMIIYAFLLIFSPIGEVLSVDSMRKRFQTFIKNSKEDFSYARVSITMQRIMLWQLAEIYFFNVSSKILNGGWGWFNGQNMLNIYRDTETFARPFVLPFLEILKPLPILLGFFIPGTLLFIAIGLVRAQDRPYAIALGISYHLFALFTTTVPYVFTFLMFSLYIIAIEPETWERWWWKLMRRYEKKRTMLFYDDACVLCCRTIACIHSADILERIQYIPISSVRSDAVMIGKNQISREDLLREMHLVLLSGSVSKGFFAYRAMMRMIPAFWITVPFLYLPGARWIGERVYAFIARNRKNV